MNKFNELVGRVIKWSEGIDLYSQSTRLKQISKGYEEFAELIAAIDDKNEHEIKDAIGDILVCIVNAAHISGDQLYAHEDLNSDNIFINDALAWIAEDLFSDLSFTVTHLTHLADACNLDINDCFEVAVKTIEKRKLLMVNGKAVKWENMTDGQKDQWRVLNENN